MKYMKKNQNAYQIVVNTSFFSKYENLMNSSHFIREERAILTP